MNNRAIIGISLVLAGIAISIVMQVAWSNVVFPAKLPTSTVEMINGEEVYVTTAYEYSLVWPWAALPGLVCLAGVLCLLFGYRKNTGT